MKKIKDFLNNGKLDYKAYADYLLAALTALSENEETLRSIYSENGNNQPYVETATENMIQNCKGMLNELQIQKKAGYPEKDKEFWNSLHYFRQSFQDWKNSLARSSGNEEFLLDKYSFEIPGEDSVDFESFFNADLFGEDTLRTYSGIKQPEPEKIIAKDTDFYSLFENGEADAELFPNDLPDPEDIHQTTDGTCYMLASLRSLARSNPHMLKAAFRDITKDTVTVRFYSQWENPRVPVDVTVSRNCIAGVDTDCAPWVRLFEKAYAVYRARKVDYDTEKKIDIRKIFNYDAPSFLNALLPTEYRNDPTANVVEKQPSFKDGKKKFSELLKSAQGTDIKTVMTLTTGKHVLDMTKVAEENGTTYVYYIDQMATEPEENRISVDRLFSPDCQFDTISVIQLNGNTPAKHISFYPEHNKKRLTELDGPMKFGAFAKDMTELLVSEVTNRFKAKGKYVNIENPVSKFARDDAELEDYLQYEFYQNFRKPDLYPKYRDFLNKCDPPEGPESPIKGLVDRMVARLSSDLKNEKKDELASELEQVFNAPVNKSAEPKAQEEVIEPQPMQEATLEPQIQEEVTKPQPKQEEPAQPQPNDELVERLKATAPSIDKQEEKWRSFAEKQTDNDLQYFTNWGAYAVTYVKDCFKDINAGNIINLKKVETFDEKLETYASIAVILKFLEGRDSGESDFGDPYNIRLKLTSTNAFIETYKNLMNNPERLIEFLTNPDKELEQLLQDNDIKALLNKQPQKNMQEEVIEPQPKEELVERLKATASSIDKQEEKWRDFAEKQTDNALQSFANWGAEALTNVKDCFKDINAGNIINLKKVETLDEKLATHVSFAVILKFLEGLASGESGFDSLFKIRLAVTSTKAFIETCKNLLNNTERLIEFLTNPDKELEQLLHDNDIKALLNKQPQKNMQEEVIEPQPKQDEPIEPQVQEEVIEPQAEDEVTNPQPKQEEPAKPQPRDELAERLKATAPILDKLQEKWRKFGEVDEDLKKFTDQAIGLATKIKNQLETVNAEKSANPRFMTYSLNQFVRTAVVLKYLEDHSLLDGSVDYSFVDRVSSDIYNLDASKDFHKKILKDPERRIEFLANPDKELERLLQDPNVIKCLDGRFPQKMQEKSFESQTEESEPQQNKPEQKQYSQPVGFVPIDQVNMSPSVPIDQIKIGPSVPIDQIKIGPSVPIDQFKEPEPQQDEPELQQDDSGQLEDNIDEPIMDPNDLTGQNRELRQNEPELQQDDPGQQLEDNIDDVIMDPNDLSNQIKIGPFEKKPPNKVYVDDELVKEIDSKLVSSFCELKSAKTVVNSGQYKDLIQTMDEISKRPLTKDNFEESLTELARKIDAYLDHKAADGVKTNTYKKLAAVQNANLWVCEALDRCQKKRPSCYAEALEVYEVNQVYKVDKTGLPDANEVVNYKAIADKLSKKDPDINEATVKNVDDCIRMIILKAAPKNRQELNGVRDTFNLVAAPNLNKTADPVKTDRQKTI